MHLILLYTVSGRRISVIYTKKQPSKKPTITGIKDKSLFSPFILSPISRAGNSKDQKLAAIITPDAKPRLASRNVRL